MLSFLLSLLLAALPIGHVPVDGPGIGPVHHGNSASPVGHRLHPMDTAGGGIV